jgi:hypothetical protein
MIADLYHYATMPLAVVQPMLTVPIPDGSYLSQDENSAALGHLLKSGYRWIRTDGETCVFEKKLREGIPANKS